ncbi:MAG: endonuclease III [Propionibacteriaceae bacterium]|jgi:endonuclease-3|nr:endonuclease III [Propionibacteriaceae bacterium]
MEEPLNQPNFEAGRGGRSGSSRPRSAESANSGHANAGVDQPHAVFEILGQAYPDAHCELDFSSPYELLVATILSAQCTDARVNKVTPALFAKYPDAAALAGANRAELEELIRSTGFFRNKADNLLKLGPALLAYGGEPPKDIDELVKLPGVGRKTANVLLSEAWNIPGLTTDTHFIRLSNRLGWVKTKNPEAVEREVGALFDPSEWNRLDQRLIWHGRRRCHAKKPACGACPVAELCPSYGTGPTDPEEAAKLVKE